MPQLKIAGELIDLGESKIALTKKFYSLDNLSSRTLTYSNQVVIPTNSLLSKKFNRPQRVSYIADKFNRYYPFSYSDNSSILFKGSTILQEANSSYKIQLLDASVDLVNNLNENLDKLDFSDDDFVFSIAEYDLKKYKNNGSVWVWPAVAMHEERVQSKSILAGGAATAKLKYSRPLFLTSKILEKMQEQTGWTISTCQALAVQSSICLSANAKKFYLTSYQKTLNDTVVFSSDTNLTDLDVDVDFIKTGTDAVSVTNGGDTIEIPMLSGGNTSCAFVLKGYIESSIDCIIEFYGVSKLGGVTAAFEFVLLAGTHFYDFETSLFETTEAYFDVNVILKTESSTTVTFKDALLYTKIEEGKLGDFKDNKLLDYYVKVHENLPSISQIELLKNCWAMFGAFHYSDNFRKILNIATVQSVGKQSALDWSAKLNTEESTWQISSDFGSFSKTNYFSYDNDDLVSELAGRGSFTIDNDTLADIGTWFKNAFGATEEVEIEGVRMGDFNIYSDTERINDINDRILYISELIDEPYTSAIFSEISGDKLLNTYYKNVVSAFKNIQVVSCYINLSRLDFFRFNGLQAVYLDHFKSTFLLYEISNYIEGRETSCKLLKLA